MRDEHPAWRLAWLVVLLVGVWFILRENASNFDWTEYKSLIEIAILVLIGEGGLAAFRKKG